jgi:hypothetical protein
MSSDGLHKKRSGPLTDADAIALHVAGATVRHENPFESIQVARNTDELSDEVVERWVMPFYRVILSTCEAADVQEFAVAAPEMDAPTLRRLLGEFDWRPRIVAAFFAAINLTRELESEIGAHLLKSEVCYAGGGYCLALASFASEGAKHYLSRYLDYYLGRPDLWFDQGAAFCALEHLDGRAAESFLPRWQAYTAD